MHIARRRFLATASAGLGGSSFLTACSENAGPASGGAAGETDAESSAEPGGGGHGLLISLAQWSLHRALRSGELDNLDFPRVAKENCGIDAVEWVNQFFFVEHDTYGIQPKDDAYLSEMRKRLDDLGMVSPLVMCDRVGNLGHPDTAKRKAAVEGHYAWLDAAKGLGCHSLRVNAASDPSLSPERQADLCADGLRSLSEKAATLGLNVIVENHGGLSSNGAWLAGVIRAVGLDNCGTLPDFGNFYVAKNRGDAEQYEKAKAPYVGDPTYTEDETGLGYDRYLGVEELMPFAKGVSAKSHDFDAEGNEIHTDFFRMMRIVRDAGYRGHVGVEYEGRELGEIEGILKTRELLERSFAAL